MKTFNVEIYYTGFCTYQIEAEDESSAIQKARKKDINHNEISGNLENWEDADTVEIIEQFKQ